MYGFTSIASMYRCSPSGPPPYGLWRHVEAVTRGLIPRLPACATAVRAPGAWSPWRRRMFRNEISHGSHEPVVNVNSFKLLNMVHFYSDVYLKWWFVQFANCNSLLTNGSFIWENMGESSYGFFILVLTKNHWEMVKIHMVEPIEPWWKEWWSMISNDE